MTTTADGIVGATPAGEVASGASEAPGAGGLPAELRSGDVSFPLVAAPGQQLSIGRRSETRSDAPDIDLADLPHGRTVSRRHAWVFPREGEWLLRVETDALNPTAIDGELIPPGLEVPLEHGQVIQVGAVNLQFHQPESAVQLVDDDEIQLELSPTTVRVEPGGAVTVSIRVINFTDHVDQFVIEVRGLPPTWYSLSYQGMTARRAEIGLFQTQARMAPASDAQARLQILFNPPRTCHSSDGEHKFTVRVTTRSSPRQRREVTGSLVMLPFQGVELSNGMARTRRGRGEYSWLVRNTGNARSAIDLSATEGEVTGTGMFAQVPRSLRGSSTEPGEPRLTFVWDRPQLAPEACEAERARLAVAVRHRHWLGDVLQYHFTVSATSGTAVASEDSYLECPPRISTTLQAIGRWIFARLPFLVVVGAVLLFLWVYFQPPQIEFKASPQDVVAGQPVVLTYTVRHATFLTIQNSNFPGEGIEFFDQLKDHTSQFTETPEQNTQYILVAQNAIGFTKSNDQVVHVHARPQIQSFTATPAALTNEGDAVQLTWKIAAPPDRVMSVTLEAVQPDQPERVLPTGDKLEDQLVDHPKGSETTYELTVQDVTVKNVAVPDNRESPPPPPPPPPDMAKQRVTLSPPQLTTFMASSASIAQGSPVTLAWAGSGFTSLSLRVGADENDQSQPEVPIDPQTVQITEHPDATSWYTLTARNAANKVSKRLEVIVTPATVAPPKVDFFVATPAMVVEGGTTTLSFSVQNADNILLRDGQGRTVLQQDTGGAPSVMQSIDLVPDRTEAFALTLTNAGGQVAQAVTVQVNPPTPTPEPTPAPTESPPAPGGP